MSAQARQRPKSVIVLNSLLEGNSVHLGGHTVRLMDGNRLCGKFTKYDTAKPHEGETVVWMNLSISLHQFIAQCDSLTDEQVAGIAMDTVLRQRLTKR